MWKLPNSKEEWVETLRKFEVRINTFSKRERIILFVATLVGLYFLWRTLVFDIFLSTKTSVEHDIQLLSEKTKSFTSQIQAINTALSYNPTQLFKKRIEVLKEENSEIHNKIIEQTKKMVTPKEMVRVIKSIISETKGLTIELLENTESRPLFNINKNDPHAFQVYKHGIRLEMRGDYFQTLRFLEAMENQESKMLWNQLTYHVEKYPTAKISLLIETLGLEEAWIGV